MFNKWNDGFINKFLSDNLPELRKEEEFFDVTLVTDDNKAMMAHQVVLAASSEFFKNILHQVNHTKPTIYLNEVESEQLRFILDFIYQGEVEIKNEEVESFLKAATELKINELVNNDESQMKDFYPMEETNTGCAR